MPESLFLKDLVVISLAAVVVVGLVQRIGLPAIAGLIIAGIIIGPNTLGLIGDPHQVEVLAEVGVVLLLFGIGLELSLDRLSRLWRLILLGGTLQMGLTGALVLALAVPLGMALPTAVFLAFLVSISSTAIVLRSLQARMELETPHGMLIMGVLVYQDLAVVPMVLLLPLLSGGMGSPMELSLSLLTAVGVLAGVLMASLILVPRALALVAATRQRNLFVMAVFVVCMGTAWTVSQAGISLALGAFLAGLVVSGSEYRTQALSDIIPVREVLTSVFFVSIGMLLDPWLLWERALPILVLLGLVLAGKFLAMFLTAALMRLPLRVAVLSAGALAQVGEFAFVLSHTPDGRALLVEPLGGDLTAAIILSMTLTPLLLTASPHLAAGVARIRVITRLMHVVSAAESVEIGRHLKAHVIIAGGGITGLELAKSLQSNEVPYILVDMNMENIRLARTAGHRIVFGDASNAEVLEHLGIHHARELVIAINDPNAVIATVRVARQMASGLHIVARTRYLGDVPYIRAAGADTIIPAELESAVSVSEFVLLRHGISEEAVERHISNIRSRYGENRP
ncbi:MAG: cation:proton antiporter [Deltaproteobacteria bacterium]|nr:cation:proton antiporter [Deltaproteobacteria bacterium]